MGIQRANILLLFAVLLPVQVAATSGARAASEAGDSRAVAAAVRPAEALPAVELSGMVTLAEALRIFRTQGLDLLIADAAVARAAADTRTAAAIANPNFSFSAGPSFNYSAAAPCSGCSTVTVNLGASDSGALLDSVSGKRRLRMQVAQTALAAAQLTRADAERKLQYQLKQQYLQLVTDIATIDFVQQLQASLGQTVELTRKRYPKVISEAELLRVQVQKLAADQAVTEAKLALRQDQVALAFLLGVRGPAPAFAVEKTLLNFQVPPKLAQRSIESLLAEALAVRPDLRAAVLQSRRSELALQLARRLQLPDIPLSLQFNMMGTGQDAAGPPYLAPGLSINLPIFYQQQGEIERAQADSQTQLLQQEKTVAQVVADIEKSYSAFSRARQKVARMQSQLLPRATVARDIVSRQYQAGSSTLIDFLDAQRTNLAANLEYLTNLTAYWTAIFALEQAVGVELWS